MVLGSNLHSLFNDNNEEVEDPEYHALWRCRSGPGGLGDGHDISARRTDLLRPKRWANVLVHTGHLTFRQLQDAEGSGQAVEEAVGGRSGAAVRVGEGDVQAPLGGLARRDELHAHP